MTSGHFGLALASILALGHAASAGVIFESRSIAGQGAFSAAYASGGYAVGISTAQRFSVEDDSILDGITFWGSSWDPDETGLANFSGFQIVIWNEGFQSIAAQWSVSMADLQIALGDHANLLGSPEYSFTTGITGTLAAGTYFMNIGAYQIDPAGNAFMWSYGSVEGGWWTTTSPTFGTWREVPNFIGSNPGGAFQLTGVPVPAPGALALLALASACGFSRRRR